MKDKLITILKEYTKEMEGYSYYGSNMGVSEDDYEEIVDKMLVEVGNSQLLLEALEWVEHVGIIEQPFSKICSENEVCTKCKIYKTLGN
jgi:hypothetical protein